MKIKLKLIAKKSKQQWQQDSPKTNRHKHSQNSYICKVEIE